MSGGGKRIAKVAVMGASRSGHTWTCEQIESWGLVPARLENFDPARYEELAVGRFFRDEPTLPRNVLVIRRWLGWLASMTMYAVRRSPVPGSRDDLDFIGHYVPFWTRIAREVAGRTHCIPDAVIVHYDRMVESPAYRVRICRALHGTYSEERLEFVPSAGNGSSFDGRRLNGRGSEMNVHGRYHDIMADPVAGPLYLEALREYHEGLDLWGRHFGLSRDEKAFLDEHANGEGGSDGEVASGPGVDVAIGDASAA